MIQCHISLKFIFFVEAKGVFKDISCPLLNLTEVGVITKTKFESNEREEIRIFCAETDEGPLPLKQIGLELEWFNYPEEIPYNVNYTFKTTIFIN